jgi:flagellar motility protein MotE (MotC chaperone)
MGRVIKILAVIIVVLLLILVDFYLELIKAPQFVKDIPVIGKLVTVDQSSGDGSSSKLTENDLLKKDIEGSRITIARLENENAELQKQLEAVKQERDTIKALNETLSVQTSQLKQLAGYYSNMKVKKAAAIMAELDDETIIGILANMGAETAAGIIGELDPVKAAVLTKKMLQVKGGE